MLFMWGWWVSFVPFFKKVTCTGCKERKYIQGEERPNWGKCFGNQGSNWLDSLCQAIRGLDSETLSVSNSLYSFAHEPAVNIRLCRYQKFCLKKKHKTSKISVSFQSFCKVLWRIIKNKYVTNFKTDEVYKTFFCVF